MKTRWIAALIVGICAIGLSASAFAETKTIKKKPSMRKVGVGTALSAGAVGFGPTSGAILPVAIYIPINVAKQFRLEPEIGFLMSEGNSNEGGNSSTATFQSFRIGVGAFFVQKLGATTRLYVGPRVAGILESGEVDAGGQTAGYSRTHINLALAVGAEHFLTMRFSLGAEAQANITMIGETEPDEGDPAGDDGQVIASNTLFMARYYF